MAKKVLIGVLLIVVVAFAARALICPAIMQNTSVSPTLKPGETMLISRTERLLNQPFQRFEVVAVVPTFLKGRAYNPVETPMTTIAELTGIPVAPLPAIELQRVIALPNETVVIRKGLGVFIDGKLLDESSYTKDLPHSDLFVLADIVHESLEEGVQQSYENSEAPIVVPPGMVFVLPDDRKHFSGSNEWGFLPQSRVVGKVGFKIAKSGIEVIKTPDVKFATEKIAINDDGVRALDKGEYTKAIHLFKSSLAIDNNFELARDNLSIAYNNFAIQSASKPEVALDSLHKALFLDPDNELTKKNLAGILKRMGKDASKYEDRIALGQDALKHHKTISALVEYRAAVKLHPSPAALAKVSMLEAQCNFPPHAIPEDLVTARVDNSGAATGSADTVAANSDDVSSANSTESRLEFGENTAGVPATHIEHQKAETSEESLNSAASDDSASASSKKKGPSSKENSVEKTKSSKTETTAKQDSDSSKLADTKKAVEEPISEGKKAVTAKDDSKDKSSSKKKKSKKEELAEKKEKSESSKKAHAEDIGTDKITVDKKSETSEKGAAESKQIATKNDLPLPDDFVPIQRQTLKPATNATNNGFDLGSFMKNLVSSFSSNNNSSEIEVTPEGYRGPPRLRKSTP